MDDMKGHSSDFYSTQLKGDETVVQMENMKAHLLHYH